MTHFVFNRSAVSALTDSLYLAVNREASLPRDFRQDFQSLLAEPYDFSRAINGDRGMATHPTTVRYVELLQKFIKAVIQTDGNFVAIFPGEDAWRPVEDEIIATLDCYGREVILAPEYDGPLPFVAFSDIPLNAIQREMSEDGVRTDIIVRRLDGWGSDYVEITPSEEILASMSERARPYATEVRVANRTPQNIIYADGTLTFSEESDADYPSGLELAERGRATHRIELRSRLGDPYREIREREEAARREHREKTRSNFEAFIQKREPDTEAHIGKLPFVPHGLSSSRRWGIEIEHPGARGVEEPAHWDVKDDGSLRSAYDGWIEVQDFEPYEEERRENVQWIFCENAESHNPRLEVYDTERHENIYIPNPDFSDPRECESCGNVTRTVLVEPREIRHTGRYDDCKEFVSPILVSMHSNGLEQLLDDLKGKPTNSSAGVHVHVEADDLTKQQVATMVYGYGILEPILDASYRRQRRDFCEARDAGEVLEAARKSKGDGLNYSDGRRYSTLNTHSLGDHGTLEFRAMGPVYEYDYLVRWAMLCRELVNAVAAGATTKDFAKIKSWDDLVMFIAKFGKEYIRAAVYEMTGEVGEAAKLEKAHQPVTNEALEADLASFVSTVTPTLSAEQLRMLGDAVASLGDATRQLVGVGGDREI